jgi:hypothetical protein
VISRSVDRMRATFALERALAKHGNAHPATWAAWGRFVAAWGVGRSPAPPLTELAAHLTAIALVAYARAKGVCGDLNRTARHRSAPNRFQGAFS